jgi:topoisomerase IA-like protein
LDELCEVKEKKIGTYENTDVMLKNGRYGMYIECGERNESIKDVKKPFDEICLDDVAHILDKKKLTDAGAGAGADAIVLRKLNDDMSIRKGKFGAYVYYKRPDMKSPQFLNIKKFSEGYLGCDENILVEWLCKTYKLPMP